MDSFEIITKKFPLEFVPPLRFPILSKRNSDLRKQLLKQQDKCIVTGWSNSKECSCAHIVPRSIGLQIGFQKVDTVCNCTLLANSIHTLFDDMDFTFDIYYFLNLGITDDTLITTRIITKKHIVPGTSILGQYIDKLISIKVDNFPSFLMHYYAYHMFHYTPNNDLTDIYRKIYTTGLYHEIQFLDTASKLKDFFLTIHNRQKKIGMYDVLAIIKKQGHLYKILWDYWDYSHTTNEHYETVKNCQAYEDYEMIEDPTFSDDKTF